MARSPDFAREGQGWPNREASRFVTAAGLRWHVQELGAGPVVLLVHGTGAATHSWRRLAPLLAQRFKVVAMDLPGHGFTTAPPAARQSLTGMGRALAGLLDVLEVRPEIAVGHSAGAAILIRMALDGRIEPARLVSLNGALLPFRGVPGKVFQPLARLMASTSLVPRLFAKHARFDRRVVERLMADTGSTIEPAGVELYRRLALCPGHVAAAFAMMANWDLEPLARDLPELRPELVLVVGERDRLIAPADAQRARSRLPGARIVQLPGLGHLAHEERPELVARIIAGTEESSL